MNQNTLESKVMRCPYSSFHAHVCLHAAYDNLTHRISLERFKKIRIQEGIDLIL